MFCGKMTFLLEVLIVDLKSRRLLINIFNIKDISSSAASYAVRELRMEKKNGMRNERKST